MQPGWISCSTAQLYLLGIATLSQRRHLSQEEEKKDGAKEGEDNETTAEKKAAVDSDDEEEVSLQLGLCRNFVEMGSARNHGQVRR